MRTRTFKGAKPHTRKGAKGVIGRFAGQKAGRRKGGVPCRCRRCQRRVTLKHKPSFYATTNAWRGQCCGRMLNIDWVRYTGNEFKDKRCFCSGYPNGTDGYPYPHRKGSPFCIHGGKAHLSGFSWFDRGTDAYLEWREAGCPIPDPEELKEWEIIL